MNLQCPLLEMTGYYFALEDEARFCVSRKAGYTKYSEEKYFFESFSINRELFWSFCRFKRMALKREEFLRKEEKGKSFLSIQGGKTMRRRKSVQEDSERGAP